MKNRIRLTILVLAALSALPFRAGADGLMDLFALTEEAQQRTALPSLLAQYAEKKAELAKVELDILAQTKLLGKAAQSAKDILAGAADVVGLGNLADAILNGNAEFDRQALLAKYSVLRGEVLELQGQIQRALAEIQRVSDAARQWTTSDDILSNLRTTFSALSPYVESSSELVDMADYLIEYRQLTGSAYSYFYNRMNDSNVDWWQAPANLSRDIERFTYYSGRFEDEMAFINTQVLNEANQLSQKERRDEIREAHRKWRSYLDEMRRTILNLEAERKAAIKTRGVLQMSDAAWIINVPEPELGSPAELDLELRQAIDEASGGGIATVSEATEEMGRFGNPILNLVSGLIGLIAIIFTAVNTAKVLKGEPQRQDAIWKVWIGALIMIIMLQVVRVLFFA